MDEKNCQEIGFLRSLLITLSIVLLGVGLFLILRYSHIMDIHCTSITMPMSVNKNTKDDIKDNITLGRLSNIFLHKIKFED